MTSMASAQLSLRHGAYHIHIASKFTLAEPENITTNTDPT